MNDRIYYPTVVLSDIHLGTSFSKTVEVAEFLKSIDCDRLILNGDIHYLNSGDWIDSLSALTEDEQGNWNIVYYDKELADEQKEMTLLSEVI